MIQAEDCPGQPVARGDVRGVAAACLGALILVGTSLPALWPAGPAFPTAVVAPAGESRVDADLAPAPHAETAGSATRRDPVAAARPEPQRARRALDLNRADAEALQALPGIGPTLAKRIVADRATHGPFRTTDDLLRVPGVGAKRLSRLRGLVNASGNP